MLQKLTRSSADLQGLRLPHPQQFIGIAVGITLLVTLFSLHELQTLVAPTEHGGGALASLPGHGGAAWRQQAGRGQQEEADSGTYPEAPAECHAREFTEMWGDVVKWGASFHTATPGECCDACLQHVAPDINTPRCNVWVWCGIKELCAAQYHECWLKHLDKPRNKRPVREGTDVGWVSGIVGPDAEEPEDEKPTAADKKVRRYHVITSAQGAAVHWQTRVHYYWYLKQKSVCEVALGGACEMGGFTRLLHSGAPDDLMDEVPTFLAAPLPNSVVEHSTYPVLNRPYAFLQWIRAANISEEYVLMSEPDHILLRPLPNLMRKDAWPAAYPFFYIEPARDDYIPIVAQFLPSKTLTKEEAEDIAQMGNSPTFMSMEHMRKVVPLWQQLSVDIFSNRVANERWGWVQEMYAFAIASYLIGVRHVDYALHLMAQPPWDDRLELSAKQPFYILHYTYGNDFSLDGRFLPGKYGAWRFDKRTYAHKPPPRHLGDPPLGMKNDMVRALIRAINEATANIPCWDAYYRTGQRPAACDEVIPGSIYPRPPRATPQQR